MKVSWGALALSLSTFLPSVSGIDTVPSLDAKKYIGRWYQVRGWMRGSGDSSLAVCSHDAYEHDLLEHRTQSLVGHLQLRSSRVLPLRTPRLFPQLYGNEYTSRITRDTTCIAADYGLVSGLTLCCTCSARNCIQS